MRKTYLNIDQLIDEILPCYTKEAVYKLTQRRKLPHYKIGKRVVFCEDEISKWMEQYHMEQAVDDF